MGSGLQNEPGQGIIRRFSDNLIQSSPTEPLNRALAAKVASERNREKRKLQNEWDQILSDGRKAGRYAVPDEEVVLFAQSQRLHSAWSKFRRSLPKDQQVEFEGHDRPDISYLVATVHKASATWQSNREDSFQGKLKSKFHSVCEACQDHSALLSMLPDDDKYLTLLTGSLSAIAQATINHQNIAEGVADTLEDLGQDIAYWNQQMKDCEDIGAIHQHIRELYVIYFEFFTEIFDRWSKSGWKRFLTSFNEGAFQKLFTARKDRVAAIERRMARHVELEFRRRTARQMDRLVQSHDELLKLSSSSSLSSPNRLHEQRLFLGECLHTFLEQRQLPGVLHQTPADLSAGRRAEDLTVQRPPDPPTRMGTATQPDSDSEDHSPTLEAQDSRNNSATEIKPELASLIDKFTQHINDLILVTRQASLLQIDRHVHNRVGTWLRGVDPGPTNLWIQGPHDVSRRPSQNSMTAVSLAALIRKQNMPCIIYSCTTTTDHTSSSSAFSKRAALDAFLASIITQLILLLVKEEENEKETGYNNDDHHNNHPSSLPLPPSSLFTSLFTSLSQGTLSTIQIIQLLRDVFRHLSSSSPSPSSPIPTTPIHIFIDNIQSLEGRSSSSSSSSSSSEYTRDFLRAVATLCRPSGRRREDDGNNNVDDDGNGKGSKRTKRGGRRIKICFTTDGYSDGLAQAAELGILGEKVEFDLEAEVAGCTTTK